MKRQLVLVFAVIGLAGWVAAAIAGPNPDAQKIDACLKANAEKGVSGAACIGIIADPCIAAASKTLSLIHI